MINEETVLAQMENFEQKMKLIGNKHKLRNIKNEKGYIGNDLTIYKREIQKDIQIAADAEKGNNKRVNVGYLNMTVN